MSDEISMLRLYAMRALYLLTFVGVGIDVWPELINPGKSWNPMFYKSVWLIAVALPLWSAGQLGPVASMLTKVFATAVVLT